MNAVAARSCALSPALAVMELYEGAGVAFHEVVGAHLLHGYVFSGPRWFVAGRAVASPAPVEQLLDFTHVFPPESCDAWFIAAMAGDVRSALGLFPHPLPWVLWQRFGRDGRFHKCSFESLQRWRRSRSFQSQPSAPAHPHDA